MEYTVSIHREASSYWADVTELEGCLTEARTLSELVDHLEDALRLWLDDPGLTLVTRELSPGIQRVTVAPSRAPAGEPATDHPG